MHLTQEQLNLRETLKTRVDCLEQKINTLPPSLKEEVILEYKLIKDFMKDKFFRSKFRYNKIANKNIGGTYLASD